jgi:nucleotide-binding universal stress UspA family protein
VGQLHVDVTRRLLVVTTASADDALLREQVRQHTGGEEVDLKVVAPAAKMSPLKWLASDEDAARDEAENVAEESARAVGGQARVETEVGDPDPVQAIEDALATFPADEVIVITRRGEQANWLEKDAGAEAKQRFRIPVTQLRVDDG